MELTPAERRLSRLLSIFAAIFFTGAVAYAVGPFLPALAALFRQLPFVANSVVKVALLGLLCLYAAGDVRGRLGLVPIVIGAHVVSIAAMIGVLALGADTSQTATIAGHVMTMGAVLNGAMILDGMIAVLVLLFYLPASAAALRHAPPRTLDDAQPLSSGEHWFRASMRIGAALFAVAAVGYELGPFLSGTRVFFVELPFVTNSVVKVATLSFVCAYVARDVRRNLALGGVLITAHIVSALVLLLLLLAPDAPAATLFGMTVAMRDLLRNAALLDGGIALVLVLLYHVAWRGRFHPRFLAPLEYRALIAVAEVVLRGPERAIPARKIAANVDGYIANIRAHRRWVYHVVLVALQLHPVLYGKAPLSELDEATRLAHLKTHFYRDVVSRLIPDFVRQYVQAMIRIAKQLTYIGYYNDPATYDTIGYVPFERRPRFDALKADGRVERRPLALAVDRAQDLNAAVIDTDACVIGSGAGGSIVAYRLAERGMKVVLVERGRYVEPRNFTCDEVKMIGLLYGDGVFEQTEDFRFTVLQGSCVGGSTVVNNAVCFDPPDRVLDRWNSSEHDAGLDRGDLARHVAAVRELMCINRQPPDFLNPSAGVYVAGAASPMPPATRLQVDAVEANIRGCVGCGYCNIGCAYGKKLSMLDRVLPLAQQRFDGRVRIISELEITRLFTRSGKRLEVREAMGLTPDGRRITIRAQRFVVAAGTIASSWLFRQSGVGRGLPIGRNMSFNMGAPLTADFGDRVFNAYDGLQISHFGIPVNPDRGFVLETWWNPPASQAVNMPGWFEQHFDNMRRYPHLMAVGVLVGTKPDAHLVRALTGGPGVVYYPDPDDLHKLGDGLAQVGEMLFAAGARRVMLNTWGYDEFTHPNQLPDVYRIVSDPSYITLGTGHPQGGNAISADPTRGVVDPRFRVHGYDNLYVCDASVFPSSLTVNPQLTVMSLADYASDLIV